MRTIAIVNQKGGCGKTTTAINLSSIISESNRKVLLIDLDPQSHSSIGFNISVEQLDRSIYDVLSEKNTQCIDDVKIKLAKNLDIVPSQMILSAIEQELSGRMDREKMLIGGIQKMKPNYDYIIIDCPPSLGILTFNALSACSEAMVPIDMSIFSLQGIVRLQKIIDHFLKEKNHHIRTKALGTIYSSHTLFSKEVMNDIKNHFPDRIYNTVIHRTVKLKEAASYGLPINKYCSNCRGAEDYGLLAKEVIAEEKELKDSTRLSKFGPQKNNRGVIFTYFDPQAKEVKIAGDFTNWEPVSNVLVKEKSGKIWKGIVPLKSGSYQYKFIVDGEWKTDPFNPQKVNTEIGIDNSLLIVD